MYMVISKLIELFGEEWVFILKEYLTSQEFDNLGKDVALARRSNSVLPPITDRDIIFKAFKMVQPSDVKVVILGQDPYPQKGVYDGYAFSNSRVLDKKKVSPSLKRILKRIDERYPENIDSIEHGRLDLLDLERWVKQGVLLVNTALTLIEGKPGSHAALWRPFTINWIEALSSYNENISWVLWGNHALNYTKYIKHGKIITEGHPSPLNNTNPFGAYSLVMANNYLNELKKDEILW